MQEDQFTKKSVEYAMANGKLFMCRYCGNISIAVNGVCLCSNCEMPVYTTREALQEKDPAVFSQIGSITDAIKRNDLSSAMVIYDSLSKDTKDPAYLYEKALLCIKQSNIEIEMIEYTKKGFMEDNSDLRDNSAKLISQARGILNEVIKACEPALSNERPPLMPVYLTFMSYLKLSSFKEADYMLGLLNRIDHPFFGSYGRMMLSLNIGKPDTVISESRNLLRPDNFSINALFYIAMAMFDKKDYEKSRAMLEVLKRYIHNRQIDALIYETEQASVL